MKSIVRIPAILQLFVILAAGSLAATKVEAGQVYEQLLTVTATVEAVDVATREDDPVGDLEGWMDRRANWYRKRLRNAGLHELGLGIWICDDRRDELTAIEIPG